MNVSVDFYNKTARLGYGESTQLDIPDADAERVFRILSYKFGACVNTEKLDTRKRRYTFVSKQQYQDTGESYELEANVTVLRSTPWSDQK